MNDQTIGQYRIISKIGEGGMGTVFEAEQQHPKRRVALKVIRGGQYVDDNTIRMFEREAQSLALLKHSSIASIYESGRTDDGQHFFAMELVRGIELREWLDKRSDVDLTSSEIKLRLDLFKKICEGVSYAHQRGVIHRDLKPGNILVLEETEEKTESSLAHGPAIKILDFGLARITESDVQMASMATEVGTILGTLQYMSPEQVHGIPGMIDVRSDVYALGVILTEILTGQLPYDISDAAFHEALRTILEVSPTPLSKLWPGERRVDRDLEVIVFKALEKEPDRRYQSALALAEDVDRYLNNQPILARAPSTIYQLRKMVRRHTIPFSLAASMVVLIIAFAFVSVAQARRAELARDESEAVTGFLSEMMASADPAELGREVLVQDILEIAEEDLESTFGSQPVIKARLHHTIGEVYSALGRHAEAEGHMREAVAIRKTELGDDDPQTLDSSYQLAKIAAEQGRYADALQQAQEVYNIALSTFGEINFRTLVAMNLMSTSSLYLGRLEEGEGIALDAIEKWHSHLEAVKGTEEEQESAIQMDTALNNVYAVYMMTGRLDDAESIALDLFETERRTLGLENAYTLSAMHNLAGVYQAQGRLTEAEPLFVEALELRERVLGREHSHTLNTRGNLAEVYAAQGRYAEAESLFNETIEIGIRTLGEDYSRVQRYRGSLAGCLVDQGKHAAAVTIYTRLLDSYRRTRGEDSPNYLETQGRLGACLAEVGRYNEAERMLIEAYTVIEAATEEPDESLRSALDRIIRLYELWRKPDKVAEWRAKLPPDIK